MAKVCVRKSASHVGTESELVVTKNPSDFIGSVLGQSEANTKNILAATIGKVLIIDEAYMLYSGKNDGGSNPADMYKTAVIDTIVAEVQSTPGEDRCVLLLGYEEQMVCSALNQYFCSTSESSAKGLGNVVASRHNCKFLICLGRNEEVFLRDYLDTVTVS